MSISPERWTVVGRAESGVRVSIVIAGLSRLTGTGARASIAGGDADRMPAHKRSSVLRLYLSQHYQKHDVIERSLRVSITLHDMIDIQQENAMFKHAIGAFAIAATTVLLSAGRSWRGSVPHPRSLAPCAVSSRS